MYSCRGIGSWFRCNRRFSRSTTATRKHSCRTSWMPSPPIIRRRPSAFGTRQATRALSNYHWRRKQRPSFCHWVMCWRSHPMDPVLDQGLKWRRGIRIWLDPLSFPTPPCESEAEQAEAQKRERKCPGLGNCGQNDVFVPDAVSRGMPSELIVLKRNVNRAGRRKVDRDLLPGGRA